MPDITIQPPLLWGYHKKGRLFGKVSFEGGE